MNEATPPPAFQPEHYAWDRWENAAKERGMERTLAELGREVIRDADQHSWNRNLQELCDEETLLDLLTRSPYLGRRLCEILIETDGLRVAFPEEDNQNDILRLPGFGGQY